MNEICTRGIPENTCEKKTVLEMFQRDMVEADLEAVRQKRIETKEKRSQVKTE